MSKTPKKMDVLFIIDATQSMSDAIKAAHNKAEDLAFELYAKNKKASFRFGCICYRDPVDSFLDVHQTLDFSDDVENLSLFLEKVEAFGGGDIPEDYVGPLNIAFNTLTWEKDAKKAIIWITDAPAHGQRYCGEENHQEEEPKLNSLTKKLAEGKFYFVGLSMNGGADKTFSEMRAIYTENEGKPFRIVSFKPESNKEVDDIGETLKTSTVGIVDEALQDLI